MNARQEDRPLQQQEDPQPPHIKEEKEDLWITQEEECLLGQEEADLSKFPLTVVSVKTEEHEDKPPESSQLHHSPTAVKEAATTFFAPPWLPSETLAVTAALRLSETIPRHQRAVTQQRQEHRLDGIHQDQLEHLIEFLTLFKSAISELEVEHHPTVQMVLLWFFKLKKHCEPKFGDPPYMKTLLSRASSLLDEKMHPTAAHKIATFLHPKFKSLKMLADEDRREVIKQVRELLLEDGEENPATEPPVTEPQSATEQGGADGTSPKKK
ncbi:uncharacterized protein LOC133545497 [Nerophis ophidion]|uniref:uncharacterized protein LOC133545497 n=1 Tax=Nerophis ophidion TaxID=159077 RepID=UPI002ADFD744|nr:uncharacterized protein LOC133545497 [Nerophis ophidion]